MWMTVYERHQSSSKCFYQLFHLSAVMSAQVKVLWLAAASAESLTFGRSRPTGQTHLLQVWPGNRLLALSHVAMTTVTASPAAHKMAAHVWSLFVHKQLFPVGHMTSWSSDYWSELRFFSSLFKFEWDLKQLCVCVCVWRIQIWQKVIKRLNIDNKSVFHTLIQIEGEISVFPEVTKTLTVNLWLVIIEYW